MVRAMVEIDQRANHILNIVKAKHNLNDKSEAINLVTLEYGENILEPELRPEYLEKLKKIRRGKYIRYGSVKALRKATS